MDEPIVLPEADDALVTELNDRINEFNARTSTPPSMTDPALLTPISSRMLDTFGSA